MASRGTCISGLFALPCVLLASLSFARGFGEGPATRPVLFIGTSLPDPPSQREDWKQPATALPTKLLDATTALFSQGMADPRGCEYRQIEVAVGNVWSGGGNSFATHGWVLPNKDNVTQRFAVCWNGLIYPAVNVGAAADIKSDVDALLESDRKAMEGLEKQGRERYRFMGVIPENEAVSFETMTDTKVCLLLRAGHTSLAEKYWAQLAFRPAGNQKGNDDPYLPLASEWAWYAFDRAVCGHMRGDDVVSAQTAQLLTRAVAEIERSAAARGYIRPLRQDPADSNHIIDNGPYLGFLEPLPALLQDEQRRVAEKPKPPALDEAMKIADKSGRIAALIRDLEEIDERQWGQPGGVGVDASPIVLALEKEGQDAVEPLIKCLESDNRLTRSVSFGRDFGADRNLIPVAHAAYLAIGNILQTHQFGTASDAFNRGGTPGRKRIVAEVKSFWAKARGKSPAEMWYETLADDAAPSSRWTEAVQKIVQPTDVEVRGGWVLDPERKPGEIPPIRGESLRNKSNPSVSQLIARRVPQVAAEEPGNSMAMYRSHDAARMALALNRWDAKASEPVLRAQIVQCEQALNQWGHYNNQLRQDVAEMTTALASMGDSGTLKEYAHWISEQTPAREASDAVVRTFEPMLRYPDNPDIAAAANHLFGRRESPWYCLPKATGYREFGPDSDLVASSLIAVPAFRKNVLDNLADVSQVGTVSIESGTVRIKMSSGGNLGTGILDPSDPLLPSTGEQRTVRVCDWYAWHLSKPDGSPQFELFWPADKRDDAVRRATEFVSHWAVRFAPNDLQEVMQKRAFQSLHMTFPRLDHPATIDDVREGRAIFSLGGRAGTAVVPIKPFPCKAKWIAFKQAVVRYQMYDPKTQSQKVLTEFDQDGVVWQAEDIAENQKVQRYYGFVGHHVIAKVPADEIKLIPNIPAWDPRSE